MCVPTCMHQETFLPLTHLHTHTHTHMTREGAQALPNSTTNSYSLSMLPKLEQAKQPMTSVPGASQTSTPVIVQPRLLRATAPWTSILAKAAQTSMCYSTSDLHSRYGPTQTSNHYSTLDLHPSKSPAQTSTMCYSASVNLS